MTTLAEQNDLEIAGMTDASRRANVFAMSMLEAWRVVAEKAKQAEKDYNAAKKIADETNAALIKALGGDG